MTNEQIATGLDEIAKAISHDSVPGMIAYGLLHFGAAVLRRGKDPVEHLSRLIDIGPEFDAISKAADAAAKAKFEGNDQ